MTAFGMKELGVYIHIPFCNSKCAYCDFASGVYGDSVKREYFGRLKEDISAFDFSGSTAVSVYFGGGTPSSIDPSYITDTLGALRRRIPLSDDAEITVECNPESFDEEKAKAYSAAGVNRLSFGLQSGNDLLLRRIGRRHTLSDFLRALDVARRYFDNFSADIMLGLPEQTLKDVKDTANMLAEEGLPHVSAYSLKVEKGTRLWRDGYTPDDDLCADMYDAVHEILNAAKLMRYEVSNFARKGKESRHNMIYWKRGEYVGFGAAAHSFFRDTRVENPRSVRDYIAGTYTPIKYYIPPHGNEAAEETIMLALRTSEGLDVKAYDHTFGRNFVNDNARELKLLTDNGFTELTGGRLRLTDKGFYVMNDIIVRLLGDPNR